MAEDGQVEKAGVGSHTGRRLMLAALALLGLSACSSAAWNNPHGLLAGLFSPGSGTPSSGPAAFPDAAAPRTPAATAPRSTFGSRIDPPTFSHVVPFPEGDGIYLQWRPVDNVTDYLVYNGPRLIGDVTTNRIRINGLLPCTVYSLRIYSSDGTQVSKDGLLVRVHTRGCLPGPR